MKSILNFIAAVYFMMVAAILGLLKLVMYIPGMIVSLAFQLVVGVFALVAAAFAVTVGLVATATYMSFAVFF